MELPVKESISTLVHLLPAQEVGIFMWLSTHVAKKIWEDHQDVYNTTPQQLVWLKSEIILPSKSGFDKIQSFALQFWIPNELHRSCSSTSFHDASAKPKLQCVCPEIQRHVLHMLGIMVLCHQHGFLWIVHLCRWQRRSSINGNFMYLGLPSCKYRVF